MWHLKGYLNNEYNDILSVSEISTDTRNVRPRYENSNTTSSTTPSQTNVQTYMMCDNQFANVELWGKGAQLRPDCTHCGKAHKSKECWTLDVNAVKRPSYMKSNESPKGRDVKVTSGNSKDFKKKKFSDNKFKGKKHVGKATSVNVNNEDEDSTESSDKQLDVANICTGCYAAVHDKKDCPMENQRIAARNKLFKQFNGKKTTLRSKSSKPEEHMAIKSIQQSYLDLPES